MTTPTSPISLGRWPSRSVLRDATLYGLARGLPGLLNLLTIALLTRLLPPEEYGSYVLVLAAVSLAVGAGLGWLREGLIRFHATLEDPSSLNPIIRRTFIWLGSGSIVIAGIMVLAGWTPLGTAMAALAVILFWIQSWYEVKRDMARVSLHPARYGWYSIARAVNFLGLAVLAARSGWGGEGVVAASALAGLGAILLVPSLHSSSGAARSVDPELLKKVVAYGAPLTATYLMWYVVAVSDRFLLGAYSGPEATGLYAASYDVIDKGLGLLMLIQFLAAYPVLVRTYSTQGAERVRMQMAAYGGVQIAISLPAAVGTAILAPDLARILVGSAYRAAAAQVIPWFAFSALLSGFKLYFIDIGFQLAGRTRRQMTAAGVAAVLSVAVNLWVIPRYGLQGAAVTSFGSAVLVVVLSWVLCRPVFRLQFPAGLVVRPLLASVGMAAAVLAYAGDGSTVDTVIRIALGAALYAALLAALEHIGPGMRLRRLIGLLEYSVVSTRV